MTLEQEKQIESEVADLKANEEVLVGLVDTTLAAANASIAAHEATIADLTAKNNALSQPSTEMAQALIDAQAVVDSQKAEIAKLTPQPATATPAEQAAN